MEETIEQLRESYEAKLGTTVPNNKKNNAEWMMAKMEEPTEADPVEVSVKEMIKASGWDIVFAPNPKPKADSSSPRDMRGVYPYICCAPGEMYQTVRNYKTKQCHRSQEEAERFVLSQING